MRVFHRSEERDQHIERHSEYNLINASQIRELADNKLLVISDNRKTTLLDIYPSHENPKFLRMMRLPAAPVVSAAQDRLVFIPL